jgi:hypothetical protein
LLGKYLTHQI